MSAGSWTLTGSNTYTGGTTINGGLLSIAALNSTAASNLGPSGQLTLNGGTLQYTGTGDTTNRAVVTPSAALTSRSRVSSADLTITGEVSGGYLDKTGPGTLTLGGTNLDNSGLGLNVLQGTVIMAKSGTSGHAVGGNGVNVSPGALLQLAAGDTYGGNIYSGATINGTFNLNGGSEGVIALSGTGLITNNASGTMALLTCGTTPSGTTGVSGTFPGILADGSGTLALALSYSSASLILTGTNNAYSGGTAINMGKLQIGDGATSPGSLPGNVTISSSTANALTFNTPAGMSITAGGNISGSSSGLLKNGAGVLTLSGSNTYSGPITVSRRDGLQQHECGFPGNGQHHHQLQRRRDRRLQHDRQLAAQHRH